MIYLQQYSEVGSCPPECFWTVQVVGAIRHKRTSGQMDGEYKHLLGKLLRLHPDYYSMWNFRKEAVLAEVRERKTRGSK